MASPGRNRYKDYRKLLENKSLDAVIVSTPDHWHAQMVIDAVHAGKDVYVEKPMAHKIEEGFAIIDAVRQTKRVVQVGTQRRSAEMFLKGKRIMDSGQLGDVHLVTSDWTNYSGELRKSKLGGELDWKHGREARLSTNSIRTLLQLVLLLRLLGWIDRRTGRAHYGLHPVVYEFRTAARGNLLGIETGPSRTSKSQIPRPW